VRTWRRATLPLLPVTKVMEGGGEEAEAVAALASHPHLLFVPVNLTGLGSCRGVRDVLSEDARVRHAVCRIAPTPSEKTSDSPGQSLHANAQASAA